MGTGADGGRKYPLVRAPLKVCHRRGNVHPYMLRYTPGSIFHGPWPIDATRKARMLLSPARESTRVTILQHMNHVIEFGRRSAACSPEERSARTNGNA